MSGQTILTSLRTILQAISEMTPGAIVQWNSAIHARSDFQRRFEIRAYQPVAQIITAGKNYRELVEWEVHIKAQLKDKTAGRPADSYVQAELQRIKDELNKYPALNGSSGVIFSHCGGWTPAELNPKTNYWESVIILKVEEVITAVTSE